MPGSLTVIGFDNIPAAQYSRPPLTTFDQRIRDTWQHMAAMLVDTLDSARDVKQELVRPLLMERGSLGPAPGSAMPLASDGIG